MALLPHVQYNRWKIHFSKLPFSLNSFSYFHKSKYTLTRTPKNPLQHKKTKPIATWKFTSSNSPPILTSSPHDPLHSISSRYTLPRYRWARPLQVYYLCQPRAHTSLSPSPQHCRGSCLSTYIFDDLNGARRVSRFRARPCTRVCFLKKQSPWRGKTFRPPAHRRPFSSPACCLYTHACRGVRLPLKARVKE